MRILLILFGLWIGLASFNVFYNSVKSVSEERQWFYLSDTAKRQKLFGELYDFYVFITNHTSEDAKILLYPKDEMSFYLARYYLYPRIIGRVDDETQLKNLSKNKKYDYIISFHKKNLNDFVLISSEEKGYLYKRK